MAEEDGAKYKQISNDIDEFLSLASGYTFTAEQIDRQYKYKTREAKRYRWQILDRKVKGGQLETKGVGKYRLFDGALEELDILKADVNDVVKISWPLDLHKYVKTWHQSINIIAGEPGAGKTGFLYNFILRNMKHKMGIVLFSNDMTAEEIKERMLNAPIKLPDPLPFKSYICYDDFGHWMKYYNTKDMINVIDYLDLNAETYRIGDAIEDIYRHLGRGIALVAIQKRPGQDIGIGGLYSWKRPKTYLSLGSVPEGSGWIHKLKIIKCRGRVESTLNPRGMEFKFYLIDGIKFKLKEVG